MSEDESYSTYSKVTLGLFALAIIVVAGVNYAVAQHLRANSSGDYSHSCGAISDNPQVRTFMPPPPCNIDRPMPAHRQPHIEMMQPPSEGLIPQ